MGSRERMAWGMAGQLSKHSTVKPMSMRHAADRLLGQIDDLAPGKIGRFKPAAVHCEAGATAGRPTKLMASQFESVTRPDSRLSAAIAP